MLPRLADIRLSIPWRLRWVLATVVLGAIAFLLAHKQVKFWAIDDAAISYAYAQAMAHGSLATFPEGPVVEGYSNPLLCLMVAALYGLGLFDPITTHLKLEALLFGWTMACLFMVLKRRSNVGLAMFGALLFAACELMTKATWIWYASGLENMLSTASLATLIWAADRALHPGPRPWLLALLLVAAALVRPEASLYSAVIAAGLALSFVVQRHWDRLRVWAWMALIAIVFFGLFLLWRWLNYHALLPNTFYAKAEHTGFMLHFQDYVVKVLLPYRFTGDLLLSAVVLVAFARWRALALVVVLPLLATSLLMPAFKGADWMGDHRFATPFFALVHMAFSMVVIAGLSAGARWRSPWLAVRALAVAVGGIVLWGLWLKDNPLTAPVALNAVNIGHVAQEQGAQRIEHQRRLGLVNPTVIMPDAGATLLMGGFRLVDSGYLTDFHMARVRDDGPMVDQYQHQEQRSEMAGLNRNPLFGFNWSLVGRTFVQHPDYNMMVRRDLVEVTAPPPGGALATETPGIRIFKSPRNLFTAGPGGLVRVEILVERESAQATTGLQAQATLAGAESDLIRLIPYGPLPTKGAERRAFLLSAPAQEGEYDIHLTVQNPNPLHAPILLGRLEVTRLPERIKAIAAALVASNADARERIWLLVQLREQLPARMSRGEWETSLAALGAAWASNDRAQSPHMERLTWDARAGQSDPAGAILNTDIQQAAVDLIRGKNCGQFPQVDERLLCLGRQVQWLRGLGILGLLKDERVRDWVKAAEALPSPTEDVPRYRALLGRSLLRPGDAALADDLLKARAALTGRLPHLPP
jgi:hypothetical protein